MKKNANYFFLILFALSCSQKENRAKAIKDITFHIGSSTSSKFIGVVPSKWNIDELIYFADPVSKKKIKLFTLEGQLIDSIPLKEALGYLGSIDGISFISRDTIIINSEYTNKFVTINSQGKCWHKPYIKSQIIDSNQNVYEIYVPIMTNFISSSNNILYHISFWYNLDDRLNSKEPEANLAWAKYFYNKFYQSSYFIKISDYFSKKPKIEFALHDFYKRISKEPRALSWFSFYKAFQQYTCVFSPFSDKLIVLNSATLKVVKEIIIKSAFTLIGVPAQPLTDQGLTNLETINNKNNSIKGYISKIFYNIAERQYYVMVSHDILDEKEKLKEDPVKHFSIIIYDNQFENPKEYAFTDGAYKSYPCLMSSQGLLLAKIPPKSKTNDQIVFTLFKF